jgi:hypothetical protein
MSDLIYIIEQIWTDDLEDQRERALGYRPIGFVFTEKEATEFCSKGRDYTSKDCWAIGMTEKGKKLPEYRFKTLKKLG